MMSNKIGLIILAAGGSSRMGRPKQLLPINGRSLLVRAAEAGVNSLCRPVVVVLGAELVQSRAQLQTMDVSIVENPDWSKGMGTSIRAGINHLLNIAPNVSAVVLTLCDQPLVNGAVIDRIIALHLQTHAALVGSGYPDGLGAPALFDRSFFQSLQSLPDKSGAKAILHKNAASAVRIEIPSATMDIDTPEDYERLSSL